jgi:hypothetical protein
LLDFVAHMQLHPLINVLREKKRIIVIIEAGISAFTVLIFSIILVQRRKIFDIRINNIKSTKLLNQIIYKIY